MYGNEDEDDLQCPSTISGKFLLDADIDIDPSQLSKAARIEALLDAAAGIFQTHANVKQHNST